MAASVVLAAIFLCGAIYTGAYAQSNGALTDPILNSNHNTVKELPDTIKFGGNSNGLNLRFGDYKLDAGSNYSLTVNWQGGSDTLKLSLVGVDDYQKEYTLSNREAASISVPKDGIYYFNSLRNPEIVNMRSISAEFRLSDAVPSTPIKISGSIQTVVFENVEMRHYGQTDSGSSIPAHPYVHDIRINYTNKKIIGYQLGMLAFDNEGNPLKIHWYSTDLARSSSFYFLYDWGGTEILPGETHDVPGGWSLNFYGRDPVVNEIAYVLYCDKEITFEDGTVWINPDFDNWRNTYEGRIIDVDVLDSYYPYVQRIES